MSVRPGTRTYPPEVQSSYGRKSPMHNVIALNLGSVHPQDVCFSDGYVLVPITLFVTQGVYGVEARGAYRRENTEHHAHGGTHTQRRDD